jgi:hypothetical protein
LSSGNAANNAGRLRRSTALNQRVVTTAHWASRD